MTGLELVLMLVFGMPFALVVMAMFDYLEYRLGAPEK